MSEDVRCSGRKRGRASRGRFCLRQRLHGFDLTVSPSPSDVPPFCAWMSAKGIVAIDDVRRHVPDMTKITTLAGYGGND
jgi:hypothetical protein